MDPAIVGALADVLGALAGGSATVAAALGRPENARQA
jgi:hypothetical protein